ncbi:MAG: type VI secretion system ATPase TssH [Myxococcota bacterium]
MVGVDIKHLLRKLNPQCTRALEGAAGLAVSGSHYEVSTDHVLLKLLEEADNDVVHILRHFEVEPSRVQKACSRAIGAMKSGNSGKPVFSPLLLTWFEEAFLLSAVDLSLAQIRSGTLLLALVAKPGRTALEDFTDEFEKVRADELQREFRDIVAGSPEDATALESDVTPSSEARPGAAETAAAGEEFLSRFCNDITAAAREGKIDPVLGRNAEIRQMIDVLTRRRKNNPIMVGEAGVGKTAVVEGFALRVASGDVPQVLRDVRVMGLDLGLLQAGAGMKGEFENRLKGVINEVQNATAPTILFIDETHTLIGAGGAGGTGDAANLLKPPLARGELRTIGATTFSEFKKYIEKDPALERRFQPIKVDEPSVETGIVMLRGVKDKFEHHHNVKVLDSAVEAAVSLSDRYISGRQLPDKAVDVIDTACARVAMGQSAKPAKLDDLERSIDALDTAISAIEADAVEAGELREDEVAAMRAEREELDAARAELQEQWLREIEAVEKIRELRRDLARARGEGVEEEAGQGEAETGEGEEAEAPLDPEQVRIEIAKATEELEAMRGEEPLVQVDVDGPGVAQVVGAWTGIPVGKMVGDELARIMSFEDDLRERVVGQDAALAAIAKKIRAAKAGLQLPTQPIGVFLLVGPSGVGKTECGLGVADLLFGGERFMTTINMSEFMEKHTVSRLIGSPPGYVGYGEGGVLTEGVRHRPYSVVLLDEIEKADPEVMNLFYQVFDKGSLSDGEGREVDFKNTVLMMTSNLASDIIMEACQADEPPSEEELLELIRPTLQQHLKPALLGRMTVLPFFPLSPEVIRMITSIKLNKVGRLLESSHDIELDVLTEARDELADRCTDYESGARNIDRMIDQYIMPRVSQRLLEAMQESGGELSGRLVLGVDDSREFTFEFEAS